MSPLWALSLFFGQPHLSLYLFWVLLRTISLLTRLSWAHWRHASYKRRYKIQICQRQKLSMFLNVKKITMTSEEKKSFKIPHQFKKAKFQKHSKQKRRKFKKRENSDKQSFKEVKSSKGRDNKENQTLKA